VSFLLVLGCCNRAQVESSLNSGLLTLGMVSLSLVTPLKARQHG